MVDWRERVIGEFRPGRSGMTVVSDPDGLLFETRVYQQLKQMGFELIPLEEPWDFDQVQHLVDSESGEPGGLQWVMVFKVGPEALEHPAPSLPAAAPRLAFSLARLFPGLAEQALKGIEAADLDPLHQAAVEFEPTGLTEKETRDFVLRHVYDIGPELVKQPSDLLALLLRLFFGHRDLPEAYATHLVSYWRKRGLFSDWPLEDIVLDKSALISFLQERWTLFLDPFAQNMAMISDWGAPYGFEYPGPLELPLGHDQVRPYISRLFAEGWLEPVEHHEVQRLSGTWAAVGLNYDPESDSLRRLHLLLTHMVENLPSSESGVAAWLGFARQWAQSQVLNEQEWYVETPESRFGLNKIRERMDRSFEAWVAGHYNALAGRPFFPPMMLHHLPWYLAQTLDQTSIGRLALIVIGGLTLSQWLVMKQVLKYQSPDFRFKEQSLFSCLPSLTSLGRRAIFSGRGFQGPSDPVAGAGREAADWARFWTGKGFDPHNIGLVDGVRGGSLPEIENWITRLDIRIAGLTVDTLNRPSAGPSAGKTGMRSLARQWAQSGFPAALIDRLLARGFRVWLTSDHGRIETVGVGGIETERPMEPGGERVALFNTLQGRARAAEPYPDAASGPVPGLAGRIPPLYAAGRCSFLKKGTTCPAHGGYALEETIVPLVEIYSRAR